MLASETAVAEDGMKVTYKLPPGITGFRYVPNHHYVEIEDDKGKILHLPAQGLMAHQCNGCQFTWWAGSNRCGFCPSCASQDVKRLWGKLQIAFVPEKESDFTPPTPSVLPSEPSEE